MTGFTALAIAEGGALAQTAPSVSLPTPITPKISVATAAPIDLLADEVKVINVTDRLRAHIVEEGLAGWRIAPERQFTAPDDTARANLDLPRTHAEAAALGWDVSKWGSLGLTAENGTGISTMLGNFTPTPLSFNDTARTSAAGLAAHVKFGDGWVTSFSYNVDVTQLDLKAGASPALATTSTQGRSYGLTIAKRGLFGSADTLGLSLSRPSDDYFGSVSLADTGLENRVNLLERYPGVAFSNGPKETDIALGYVTTFFNGALALQANAGYQMNVGGQNGANSVTVLSRAKINF
ncbi:MAG TPA: hypothetical protein VHU18_12390 [Rhizomicrobium sp.]|nr:hypothetical protein [Rhizomicrobium sp.]